MGLRATAVLFGLLAVFGSPAFASSSAPANTEGRRTNTGAALTSTEADQARPEWGRFLNQDPIGFAGGSNLYSFVGSAPLLYSDPLGLARNLADFHPTKLYAMTGLSAPGVSFSVPGERDFLLIAGDSVMWTLDKAAAAAPYAEFGRLKWSVTPREKAQASRALLVNSGPLSTTMTSG